MSSLRRILASRANGLLSRGPKTPEGKAISSQNALKLAQTADTVCLSNESAEVFQLLLDACIAEYKPSTDMQNLCVEEIAVNQWRIRRCWVVEIGLFEAEMDRQAPGLETEFAEIHEGIRLARAHKVLADAKSFNLLSRQESRYTRNIDRATGRLLLLKQLELNPVAPAAETPSDTPAAEPPESTELESAPSTNPKPFTPYALRAARKEKLQNKPSPGNEHPDKKEESPLFRVA